MAACGCLHHDVFLPALHGTALLLACAFERFGAAQAGQGRRRLRERVGDAAAHLCVHRDVHDDYTAWPRMAVRLDHGGVDADDVRGRFANQRGDRALLHPAAMDHLRSVDGRARQFRLPTACADHLRSRVHFPEH